MLTLSPECQKVVDSVMLLAAHNHPSMFLIMVQSRTGMNTDYIHNRLKDWVMERHTPLERRHFLEEILLAALDVQSEAIHGIDWQKLCGVDYKIRVKMLMEEL